jgi:hypothetical protein
MNNKVTRVKVAKQFTIAIQLLLGSIEQSDSSTKMGSHKTIDNHFSTQPLLTCPHVAKILNIA